MCWQVPVAAQVASYGTTHSRPPTFEHKWSAVKTLLKYWCEKGLLVTVEGPEGRWRTTIDKPFARVGAHPLSEVVLPGAQVAQRGFYLHATDRGVFCVDLLHSATGDRVNHGWLHPSQIVTLGPYKISAQLADDTEGVANSEPDLDAKGTVEAPFPRLTVSINGRKAARRRLRRRLTVLGRNKAAPMQLMGNYVSATHCVMYWDGGSLWAVDLLSANGTSFADAPIEAIEFPLGSTLMLGNVELTFASMVRERRLKRKGERPLEPTGPTAEPTAEYAEPPRLPLPFSAEPPPTSCTPANCTPANSTPANCTIVTVNGGNGAGEALLADDLAEDGDELFQDVTNRLIRLGKAKRWHRRRKWLLAVLAISLTAAVAGALLWRFWDDIPGTNSLAEYLDTLWAQAVD